MSVPNGEKSYRGWNLVDKMGKIRLDQAMVKRGLVSTRSQAESYIRLGQVTVNGVVQHKPGVLVAENDTLKLTAKERYVSRAGHKLASVASALGLKLKNRVVLDVGSSTGGFTDYALQHGAKKVIAVDVGTNQLHPSLTTDKRVELHEKTDVRHLRRLSSIPDVVLIDVSFTSIRNVLPAVAKLSDKQTVIVAMVKPQFETQNHGLKHKGVIKNDRIRRDILKDFEVWAKKQFTILTKADSDIAGAKGNRERFYVLKRL